MTGHVGDLGEGIVDVLGALVPCEPCNAAAAAGGAEHQCAGSAPFAPGAPCSCCLAARIVCVRCGLLILPEEKAEQVDKFSPSGAGIIGRAHALCPRPGSQVSQSGS